MIMLQIGLEIALVSNLVFWQSLSVSLSLSLSLSPFFEGTSGGVMVSKVD